MPVFAGALLCRDHGLLLGKRSANRAYYPDVWDIPGGHCEQGESVEETLVRELREEIGVTPSAWQELAVLRGFDATNETIELHVFVVTGWEGTPRNLLPAEHDQIAWFAVEDACRLPLAHSDYPEMFRRALAVDR